MVPSARPGNPASVSIPDDLESSRAKLVYLYLAIYGESTADELCAKLEMEKGATLSIVGTLRKRGHIERDGKQYLTV